MTSKGAFKLRIPPSILRRGVRWDKICFSRGSGQFPGGNPSFTGAQWPSLLIPCNDGTCQHLELDLPAELIRQDDYIAESQGEPRGISLELPDLIRGRR